MNKSELQAYLSQLYFVIEREQTSWPNRVNELKEEIRKMKTRCQKLEVNVPTFTECMKSKGFRAMVRYLENPV